MAISLLGAAAAAAKAAALNKQKQQTSSAYGTSSAYNTNQSSVKSALPKPPAQPSQGMSSAYSSNKPSIPVSQMQGPRVEYNYKAPPTPADIKNYNPFTQNPAYQAVNNPQYTSTAPKTTGNAEQNAMLSAANNAVKNYTPTNNKVESYYSQPSNYSSSPVNDYSNYQTDSNLNNYQNNDQLSTPDPSFEMPNPNFETQNIVPASVTSPTSLAGGASPYIGQINSIKERLKKAKDEYDLYGNQDENEKALESQLDQINANIKLLNAKSIGDDVSLLNELKQTERNPLAPALNFVQGQQRIISDNAELKKQSLNAQIQGLAAQAEPLTTKLARLQAQRSMQQEAKKNEMAAIQSELEQVFNEQRALAPQLKEVAGNLIEYDPSTGGYRTVFSAQQNENYKPIEVNSGATLIDPRTGKVIYSAPAASEKEKVTDDIAEFNVARQQGFKGNFVDFKRELANLVEKGTSASNLPAAYKEYQLAQSDPSFAKYLQGSKPMSQDQIKAASFANRLQDADTIINQLGSVGAQKIGLISGNDRFPNILKSPERQQLEQAQTNFITAVLRRESGAAISPSEFSTAAKQYFPQPGDSSSVMAQKAASRKRAIKNLLDEAGKGSDIYNTSSNTANRDPLGLGFNQPLSMGLNGSLKPQAEKKYPTGVTGGQCGDFAHKLVDFPSVGDGKLQKFKSVDKFGIQANEWRQNPKVGDVLITDENPTYGHVAVVNEILPNGMVRLSESNFRGKEKVSHDRLVSLNSAKIYGAIRGKLKV